MISRFHLQDFCDSRNSYDELPHQYESSKENKHQVHFENVQIIKHIQYVFVIIISYVNTTMMHLDHLFSTHLCHRTTVTPSAADFWVVEIPGGAEGPGAWQLRMLEVTKPKPSPSAYAIGWIELCQPGQWAPWRLGDV